MTATVVPINPRHWQEMLWEDQTLWDGIGPLVLAELDERIWNVTDHTDKREQTLLLGLRHGYVDVLESYVAHLEATDPEMAKPRPGKRDAWVFDYSPERFFASPQDEVATAIVPRVEDEQEPSKTVETLVTGRKFRKKRGTRR